MHAHHPPMTSARSLDCRILAAFPTSQAVALTTQIIALLSSVLFVPSLFICTKTLLLFALVQFHPCLSNPRVRRTLNRRV